MWTLLSFLFLINGILGAPVALCPKSCSCTASETYLKVDCKSFDGLEKSQLSPEQITAIMTLDVNGLTTKTNPDLSHLNHLKRLTLTSNKIQEIVVAHLPKSLVYLDVSKNFITHLPQTFELLPRLKEIDLFANPISCDCASLAVRDRLLDKGITVTKRAKCESPENLRGKAWLAASCERNRDNLFGGMQGDAPYEGSGSYNLITDDEQSTDKTDAMDQSIEEEFIPIGRPTPPSVIITTAESIEFEGSGDENESNHSETTTADPDDYEYDYDEFSTDVPVVTEPPVKKTKAFILDESPIKACNFNCSTPSPITDLNDTDVSPPPGFIEGVKIVLGDVLGNSETTTTSTSVETTAPANSSTIDDTSIATAKENEDAEVLKNVTITDEKENLEEPVKSQTNIIFIFFTIVLLVVVCIALYILVKKRNGNAARSLTIRNEGAEKIGEEIELISKDSSGNDKPNGTHETIALMNGHNENQTKSAEDILPSDNKDSSDELEEDEYDEEDDVELRPKQLEQTGLITPEAQRVTIKASEIPNSTPKTPILVTRHVNSDGSVVTTLNVDQPV